MMYKDKDVIIVGGGNSAIADALYLEKICKIPVQITVGERDTAFIGDSPYGSNRLERMKSLKANLEANGLSVCLEILSGLEHGGGEDIRINTAQEFFERYL